MRLLHNSNTLATLPLERQYAPIDISSGPGKMPDDGDDDHQLQAPPDSDADQVIDGPPEESEHVKQPEEYTHVASLDRGGDAEVENDSHHSLQRSMGHLATDASVTAVPGQTPPAQRQEDLEDPQGLHSPETQEVQKEELNSGALPDVINRKTEDESPEPLGNEEIEGGNEQEKDVIASRGEVPPPSDRPPAPPSFDQPDEPEDRNTGRPYFPDHIARLERIASEGIGLESPIAVRAGLESETVFRDPSEVRSLQAKIDPDDPLQADLVRVRNPEVLVRGGNISEEALQAFRDAARAQIEALQPQNEAERERKEIWLRQFEDEAKFGPEALINWRIYDEFSRPTLENTTAPHGTLEELDHFAERQGWLEFRFGTEAGGWYDMNRSEFRFTPCSPSELIVRRDIIRSRIDGLATENNLAVMDRRAQLEHVNLSVYAPDAQGVMQPIIGHSDDRQAKTLDMAAGVAAAFQDGLHFDPYLTGSPETFRQWVVARDMRIGPFRGNVRIVEDRIEQRSVPGTEQALATLIAGALYGLRTGVTAIQEKGYQIPEIGSVLRVHRTPDFEFIRDVEIQRALETIEPSNEGGFRLDPVYNTLRGGQLLAALTRTGSPEGPEASANLNVILFRAMRLNDEGTPYIDIDALVEAHPPLDSGIVRLLVGRINPRLQVVRLEPAMAIKGDIIYPAETPQQAAERLRSSEVAALALNGEGGQAKFVDWLKLKS